MNDFLTTDSLGTMMSSLTGSFVRAIPRIVRNVPSRSVRPPFTPNAAAVLAMKAVEQYSPNVAHVIPEYNRVPKAAVHDVISETPGWFKIHGSVEQFPLRQHLLRKVSFNHRVQIFLNQLSETRLLAQQFRQVDLHDRIFWLTDAVIPIGAVTLNIHMIGDYKQGIQRVLDNTCPAGQDDKVIPMPLYRFFVEYPNLGEIELGPEYTIRRSLTVNCRTNVFGFTEYSISENNINTIISDNDFDIIVSPPSQVPLIRDQYNSGQPVGLIYRGRKVIGEIYSSEVNYPDFTIDDWPIQ